MQVRITNRSDWPTPFLEVIVPWITKRAGITWKYHVLMRSAKSSGAWSGCGGQYEQRLAMPRRWPGYPWSTKPYRFKDHRFKWGPQYELRSIIEICVFLIAHEACHAVDGDPRKWVKKGQVKVSSMEFRCNEWAMNVVEDFRQEWPALRKKIKARMVSARRKEQRAKAAKSHKKSPDYKLQLAQRNLDQWEAKQKYAANKIKKYRQKIRYYQGRVAAKTR